LKEGKQQFEEKSDKQKTEDKKNTGIALFGRILRRHVGNISTLTEELISELVHFTGSEIGGIYVREKKGDEFILNLRASYAYNEKKMIQKEIQFGEGLVGTCAVDKSTLFIDKTDENYIKIISGFGHSKPSSILISPIVVENEVFGVIELASLKLYNQDDIDFIELFAEDIAYTLSYLLASENR
jgi:putative methionine-R-sulfoxide reductase with GAF domain